VHSRRPPHDRLVEAPASSNRAGAVHERCPASAVSFNWPLIAGDELAYVRDAIDRGRIAGDGFYTNQCESVLSDICGGARVLLTTSGTHALEIAALLLDIAPGDEVIVPAFTFVSTPNTFALRGARPVFVDIRAETLNLDERLLSGATTPRTRAIVVMHYGGMACDMDAIVRLTERTGVTLIEDNAHGLFGSYRGRPLGSFGVASALSFHESKNVTCGEGGAIVLNDPGLVERALVLREKGTDRNRFVRGEVDKYQWLDVGSSYVLSDMLAGFLYGQLEARVGIQEHRRAIWHRYQDGLADWAHRRGVMLPTVPPLCTPAYHLFQLILPSPRDRQSLIAHLHHAGIEATFHYLPLHLSPMGQQFGGRSGQCPITEWVSERLVRLPFFNGLTTADEDRVIAAVCAF